MTKLKRLRDTEMTDKETTQPEVEYPYHLCPICGLSSGSTSRICSRHNYWVSITGYWKDSMGRPIINE